MDDRLNPALEHQTCRLCYRQLTAPTARLSDDTAVVQCRTCGTYEITADAFLLIMSQDPTEKRYLLSGRARMADIETGVRHRFLADEIEASKAGRIRERTYSESALSLMRYLSIGRPGSTIRLEEQDYPVAHCKNFAELKFVIEQLSAAGLIGRDYVSHAAHVQVTGRGWQWLEAQIREGAGQQAFIAVSFAEELAGLREALKAGIRAAGYNAVLVSDREFSDGVLDRIFAEIRRSHFVVADFTENKAGVYYEAGFALGLGLTVVGTCQDTHLKPKDHNFLHFDVRGLNMIPWTEGALEKLAEKVKLRILAKFPQGPVKQETT